MKMTRLEWSYLQKVALDHPYYDTHKPPLTDAEARAITEENNVMTGKEFVDSIYANLGMTRPKEEKKRFAWLHNIGELFTVPPIRRIAIAVLVAILMIVFFAATPTGRAIAEGVIQYIATLLDDGRVTVNRTDSVTALAFPESVPVFTDVDWQESKDGIRVVSSIEEFTKTTGKVPAVLPFPYSELYYDCSKVNDYLALYTLYETPKGMIHAYQIWNVQDLIVSTSMVFTAYDADPSIYYSVEEDGTICVLKILEDSVWMVAAEGSCTIDECIRLLKNE